MSTDVKLGKAQISRIIQSGRSFRSWLANLRKKAQTSIIIPLPRDNLFGLIGNVTSNALDIFERKLSVKGCVRAGKGFFFQWRYQNHKITGRFGCIHGITGTVKQNEKGRFLGPFLTLFSHFSNKRYKWKMSQKCRKRIYGQTFVVLLYHLNNIEITNHFSYEPRFNGFFSRNNISRIKDGAYVINRDDENSTGTHWVSLFIDRNTAVYFDYFGIEYIPQEILKQNKRLINYSQYV